MRLPRREDRLRWAEARYGATDANPANADALRLAEDVVPQLNQALGASWYERSANEVDLAVATLCRLRRAGAGQKGNPQGGDAAVRQALEQADPEAVLWIASRAISYMDEQGFPELVSR